MLRFKCPQCHVALKVADDKAGQRGRCPKCKAQLVIPELPAPETTWAPPAAPSRASAPELPAIAAAPPPTRAPVPSPPQPNREEAIREQRRKEISDYYKRCYDRVYSAARDRVLGDVVVHPGQNPYQAGHAALLQHRDEMVRSARDAARRETIAKYEITERQLQSLIASGQTSVAETVPPGLTQLPPHDPSVACCATCGRSDVKLTSCMSCKKQFCDQHGVHYAGMFACPACQRTARQQWMREVSG